LFILDFHDHVFVSYIETKALSNKLYDVRRTLGFEGLFSVDPVGREGGLALLWKVAREVEIVNYSLRHISANICVGSRGCSWMFIGFCGNPNPTLREASWKLLAHLSSLISFEWLCVGDFNKITAQFEKVGGRARSEVQMEKFQKETVWGCGLGDLGYKGPKFTWRNKRAPAEFVKEHLDKALANKGWCSKFPDFTVEVLAACSSYHNPLWINFYSSWPLNHQV
jgi:hypothetical protein